MLHFKTHWVSHKESQKEEKLWDLFSKHLKIRLKYYKGTQIFQQIQQVMKS